MVTKRCAWGTCRSDSRYKHKPHMLNVFFVSFPKPKSSLERCIRWLDACCRPYYQLNINKIKSHHFVCSKVSRN
uniref:THAP-type domain-containing protein n=1 Tax=Octopus bimaculoides TaxID=37653 RepID=A0A0L8GD04_OCTBM